MSSEHGNQKVTDTEIIDAIRSTSGPVASARDVATRLSMTRTGINERLQDLLEEGRVSRKSVGNGYVWWVNDYSDDSAT
ncbi:winged helix-turn-helix transcriptional regulator [Halobaculum sp. EA56]|uniref:winged helix-turn-helix transcriptional regulator n=1 Tax=Halobaculum sp. EA56 TaxID=3421648 RepID=UPI003EBECC70